MSKKVLSSIECLYSNNLQEFGLTSQSVGWLDGENYLRFDQLFNSFNTKNVVSLNDLGCGYGTVLNYLSEREILLEKYYGYDISRPMLDALNPLQYPKLEISKFCDSKLSTSADYSIACGIFNVKFSEKESVWTEYILSVLENLNKYSQKGFSFNLLSTYVDFKMDHLYYGDPLFFLDYCKRNFSRYVSLLHDYPLWEWTLVVKKQ